MSLPEAFRTARLQAERLAPHHLGDLIEFHRDANVMAELGGVRDEEQTAQYLTRNLDHWAENGFGVWMLRERDGPDFIGRAVLRNLTLAEDRQVEIGFALVPRLWGRGLATEVAGTCAALAWRGLEVPSLVGVTTPANLASQRVLLKIGFDFEGGTTAEGTRCFLYRADRPTSKATPR